MTSTRSKSQVTVWGFPTDTLQTIIDRQLYTITYGNWLNAEIDRWHDKNGREAWVQENKEQVELPGGYIAEKGEVIALFTWSDWMKPVDVEGSK